MEITAVDRFNVGDIDEYYCVHFKNGDINQFFLKELPEEVQSFISSAKTCKLMKTPSDEHFHRFKK